MKCGEGIHKGEKLYLYACFQLCLKAHSEYLILSNSKIISDDKAIESGVGFMGPIDLYVDPDCDGNN